MIVHFIADKSVLKELTDNPVRRAIHSTVNKADQSNIMQPPPPPPPPFLGSTAQLRPWPPPQNLAEFLGGFSTILFLQGRVVSPMPNPHPKGPGLCIYISQRQGGYPF
jgi:hypothetical protein